jgi:molybdenum cofactor cytidylyltransferase
MAYPMSRRADRFVSGLVLAGAHRLGSPLHLRPLRRVVATARACRFDQLLIAVGGAAAAVAGVDFAGADVILEGDEPSSFAAALHRMDPRTDVLVLLLGDQPRVTPATVQTLVDGMGLATLAACGYASGRGHPLAFGRDAFGELSTVDEDAGIWQLLERHRDSVVDVPITGRPPRDDDVWSAYGVPAPILDA